jgi:hypothetical protein
MVAINSDDSLAHLGEKYGRLTILSRADNDRFGRTQWNCRCDCGEHRVVALFRMTSGHTKSCGCIKGLANATHRMRGTATHNSWCAMKQRCNVGVQPPVLRSAGTTG